MTTATQTNTDNEARAEAGCVTSSSDQARERFIELEGSPLLLSNWERVLFLHYEIEPELLQPHVPFTLDVHDDRAWVSLVAFTMTEMRPAHGGRISALAFRPFREQRFLNLRTYVRHRDEPGIHFIAEWMSDWLCVQLGPLLYGLPYRWGKHVFDHDHGEGRLSGHVEAREGCGRFAYSGKIGTSMSRPGDPLDAFLLERYTAFTRHRDRTRMFRIWHEPWAQRRAEVSVTGDSLIAKAAPWWRHAVASHANYSAGAFDIWMGRPWRLPERD